VSEAAAWAALAGLGAFHGLNPAMGWLFAVALGLQQGNRGGVLRALPPIAVGHALSVALVVAALAALRVFVDVLALQIGSAVALIGFGLYRLRARHAGKVGMRVSGGQLVLWSFLMATAHGAGLMLAPVLLEMPMDSMHAHHAHMMTSPASEGAGNSLTAIVATALAVVAVHTLAMLVVAGAIAVIVYEWVGLAFLRRGWINLDLVWVLALIGAGVILLVTALA